MPNNSAQFSLCSLLTSFPSEGQEKTHNVRLILRTLCVQFSLGPSVNEHMATHPDSLAAPRGALRWIRDVVLTVIVCAIASISVFAIIKATTEAHWSLGLVVTVLYAGATYLGLDDLRSRQAQ